MRELPPDDVPRPGELRIRERLPVHELHGIVDRRQRIAKLVREHGQEFVLVTVGFLQSQLDPRAFRDLGLQRAVGRLELLVRPLQNAVQRLQLARFLRLQRGVGLGQTLVRLGKVAVELLQLAPLGVSSMSTATLLRRISGTTGMDT